MPDQYDPKVSPRATAGRPDARRVDSDPLAELARIVQGRPSPAPTAQQKAAAHRAPASGGGLDLEAELMSDLQASFAAVRDALPPSPPPAAPRAQPQPAMRAPVPEPVPAPVVEQRAAPIASPPQSRQGEAHPELRDEFRLEPIDEARLTPIPAPPVIQPMIQVSPDTPALRQMIERVAERRAELPPEREPEPMPRAVRPPPAPTPAPPVFTRAAEPARPDLGSFQLRGSTAAAPPQSRQPHSRWETPETPKPAPAPQSRFAPPKAIPPPVEEEPELDPFADGGLFADQVEAADAEEEDFPLDGLPAAHDFDEEEHLPPLEDDLDAMAKRRGPNRTLMLVAGVVAVAVIGGGAFALFSRGDGGVATGTPPVIAADGAPTKITPADTATNDTDSPNKLIYDRVNSNADNSTGDTTLLAPDNGTAGDTQPGAVSRVIIPGGPGIDQPGASDAAPTTQPPDTAVAPTGQAPSDGIGALASNDAAPTDQDAIQPIGPRKVRTVVVKPDGTIVSSNAAEAGSDAPLAAAPADTTAAAQPVQPAPAAEQPPAPAPVADDMAAISGANGEALPLTPDGAPPADAAPAEQAPVAEAPAAKPAATKPAATKPANTEVAANDDASPIDITPGAKPAAASSGVLVQISSQRTEDAARATYKDLQARYPNILGSYGVNIQRADVPDRGTFYRVRVGPFSQADAQRLCDDLRSAGGDCVLATR